MRLSVLFALITWFLAPTLSTESLFHKEHANEVAAFQNTNPSPMSVLPLAARASFWQIAHPLLSRMGRDSSRALQHGR